VTPGRNVLTRPFGSVGCDRTTDRAPSRCRIGRYPVQPKGAVTISQATPRHQVPVALHGEQPGRLDTAPGGVAERCQLVSAGTAASQKSSFLPVEPLTRPRSAMNSSSNGSSGVPPSSIRISKRTWPGFLAIALPSSP